jgi:hypothetical protein
MVKNKMGSEKIEKEIIEGYEIEKVTLTERDYDTILTTEDVITMVTNKAELEDIIGDDMVLGALVSFTGGIMDIIVGKDFPCGLEIYRFQIEKVEYTGKVFDYRITLKIPKISQ